MSTKLASCVGWWTNVPGQSLQFLLNCAVWIVCNGHNCSNWFGGHNSFMLNSISCAWSMFLRSNVNSTGDWAYSLVLKVLVDRLHDIKLFLKFTLYNQCQDDFARNKRVGTFPSWISVLLPLHLQRQLMWMLLSPWTQQLVLSTVCDGPLTFMMPLWDWVKILFSLVPTVHALSLIT